MKPLIGLLALVAFGVGVWQFNQQQQRPDGAGEGAAAAMPGQGPAGIEAIRPEGMAVVPVYSPAVRSGGVIYLSGAIGTVPGAGLVEGGVQAETRQALQNVSDLLEVAGAGVEDLLQCNVYLADIADYGAMNEVYGAWVGDPAPARTTVAVAGLPLGARVEVACTARDPGAV